MCFVIRITVIWEQFLTYNLTMSINSNSFYNIDLLREDNDVKIPLVHLIRCVLKFKTIGSLHTKQTNIALSVWTFKLYILNYNLNDLSN